MAVDASLIAADANKQRSVPGTEWKVQDDASRSVREYLSVLDDAGVRPSPRAQESLLLAAESFTARTRRGWIPVTSTGIGKGDWGADPSLRNASRDDNNPKQLSLGLALTASPTFVFEPITTHLRA